MKEATGELNMTVVTVVAIAAVGAFFYAFIWPGIQNNIKQSTYCASARDCDAEGNNCTYFDEDNNPQKIDCQSYIEKNTNK